MTDALSSITGNLTGHPELRFTAAGLPVVNFTVAVNRRQRSGTEWVDLDPLFVRCTAWRELAEHIAQSCSSGTRVLVTGDLEPNNFVDRETGKKRTSTELVVRELGVSLRFATAVVTRSQSAQLASA